MSEFTAVGPAARSRRPPPRRATALPAEHGGGGGGEDATRVLNGVNVWMLPHRLLGTVGAVLGRHVPGEDRRVDADHRSGSTPSWSTRRITCSAIGLDSDDLDELAATGRRGPGRHAVGRGGRALAEGVDRLQQPVLR